MKADPQNIERIRKLYARKEKQIDIITRKLKKNKPQSIDEAYLLCKANDFALVRVALKNMGLFCDLFPLLESEKVAIKMKHFPSLFKYSFGGYTPHDPPAL